MIGPHIFYTLHFQKPQYLKIRFFNPQCHKNERYRGFQNPQEEICERGVRRGGEGEGEGEGESRGGFETLEQVLI